MKNFNKLLQADNTYRELEKDIRDFKTPQLLTGVSSIQKAHFIYSFAENLERKVHILMPDEASAVKMCEDINSFEGEDNAFLFPARELVFHDMEGISLEYEHMRLGVLGRIIDNRCKYVVSSVEGAVINTMSPDDFADHTMTLKSGESYNLDELISDFVSAGYERADQVEGVSHFAVRGGIVDIFPTGESTPYRIEFWGDEIDTITTFDIASQRREDSVDTLNIPPTREALIDNSLQLIKKLEKFSDKQSGKHGKLIKEKLASDIQKLADGRGLMSADRYLPLLYKNTSTIFDYCKDRLLFVCEPAACKENLKNIQWQQNEDIKIMLEDGTLFPGCDNFAINFPEIETEITQRTSIIMDTFVRSVDGIPLAGSRHMNSLQLSSWSGDYSVLKEDLDDLLSIGFGIVIMAGTERACDTLMSDLTKDKIIAQIGGDLSENPKGKVVILPGSVSAGFKYLELGFALISHTKTAATPAKRKKRYKGGKKVRQITDLQVGDYVVHVSHGIGVFEGIIKRTIQGITKDYIKIKYAGTDALFVPVTQMDLVSKYIGASEGHKVKLNRLNSVEWQKTRSRVKGAVKEMAKELTALYAKRMSTEGYAFAADDEWQRGFESRFPYEETDDQLRCVREIKEDMEKPMPMDRLLCGDVGFGKTEVALRAVFKAVMDSKQVAVLVPTTILAWQHYQTFINRMKDYPIKVELLSRFRTPKQQKEIIKEIKKGQVDVVVGTHRVVQKDVEFKDLGLAVIDEEQRFGVLHKERFKEMRADVDVLTLSATPIPRTLNMALSGIRDMSIIEEAPQNRHPVQTYVLEYDLGIILQAIQKELRRGGQVFYLHNNIGTIDRTAEVLRQELPDANIVTAHGRMGEAQLSEIWRKLLEHEIDVLVCTTIIEAGVDVPNCNTLIVDKADYFGLSQLYQIRGRVGRSNRRAYAYFTFQRGKALSDIAEKRLSAIKEFTTFGSGFQIAMRDLEIRGAGNVLGASQHGHMEAVGYDLYLKLLAEAVGEETGEERIVPVECTIDIQLDAYIPENYIENTVQRIDAYKRISAVESVDDSQDVIDELIDRFGEPPKAVMGLLDVALIRGTAAKLGITEITQTERKIILYPEKFDMELAGRVASEMHGRVLVNAGDRPYYSINIEKNKNVIDTIRETLEVMSKTSLYTAEEIEAKEIKKEG